MLLWARQLRGWPWRQVGLYESMLSTSMSSVDWFAGVSLWLQLLLVMGDHGQTVNGDHGGGTPEEVGFRFPTPFPAPYYSPKSKRSAHTSSVLEQYQTYFMCMHLQHTEDYVMSGPLLTGGSPTSIEHGLLSSWIGQAHLCCYWLVALLVLQTETAIFAYTPRARTDLSIIHDLLRVRTSTFFAGDWIHWVELFDLHMCSCFGTGFSWYNIASSLLSKSCTEILNFRDLVPALGPLGQTIAWLYHSCASALTRKKASATLPLRSLLVIRRQSSLRFKQVYCFFILRYFLM